jgi:hypothetical protein
MHGLIGGCWGGDDNGVPETMHSFGKPMRLSPADLQRNAEPVAYLTGGLESVTRRAVPI